LVTPAAEAAVWSHKTMEQSFLQSRLMRNGVHIIPHHRLVRIGKAFSRFENVFVGTARSIEHDAIVLVTARQPDRTLHDDLARTRPNARLTLIGDASAPGTLAHVTYSAHRAARAIIGAVG
jgi:dimethylamine/trimethylamine dehydrogenase